MPPSKASPPEAVELERALRLLERGIEPALVFEDMSRRLMNKLLHAPTKALLNDA